MNRYMALSLVIALSGCGGAAPSLPAFSTLAGDFRGPESAHWDPEAQVWYVTSWGQNLDLSGGTPDQPAYITRLDRDGTVLEQRVLEIDGDLLGVASLGDRLYVAHGNELLEVDPARGEARPIEIPGAMFLNDVATGRGAVYASDTGANRIYRYTPGGSVETYSSDPALTAPNGIVVEEDGILVVTLGAFPPDPATPGAVFRVGEDGAAERFGTVSAALDGIERDGDGWVVSEFGGKIWRLDSAGRGTLLRDLTADGLSSSADIGFDPSRRVVLVPDLVGNTLHLLRL
jgi:sugar lactone lactonase YvrE